ncbi:sucrose-phosphate synthase [Sphingomonas sp. PP-F2F-G114-C0414]|uniref:HAD-IIB family hydrolase n=1 Tax=Sphingomonas sp. PP-F2F-G114-C0414 TaxID=2135662 RepID=UPI000EF8EE8F|nr:HAD-IIB family hydrolase [Sphingomonas sp. PP-F2F-G114-C0414]RMB28262.1 sucrose-phosphate synthase [Sphingomonas sp. PP-F2F-G114-C0414]
MAIALGGCLKGPPIEFGLTEDTGGHITYTLGAALALSARDDVDSVEIVTRLIEDDDLGVAYAVPYEPVSAKLGIRRIATANRRYLGKGTGAADRPAFAQALIDHIETLELRPDVIHAHFADAADVAMLVRERFGIPFIYTAHSLGIEKAGCSSGSNRTLAPRIAEEDRAIAAADAIIASSRDEAERQLMLYPSACPAKIHCVPPGAGLADSAPADPTRARALIAPFLRAPDKPIILAIARPVAKKNLVGLIDLFASDARLRDRANLVIVAGLRDGPDTGEDEQRAVIGGLLAGLDRHDLYGTLALPKRHTAGDVASLYALAQETGGVFVNPALTEPYGLTLTEAALHGLPVVATCHGGPADIVARLGHGSVADPRDHAGFAAAINALLDDRIAWKRASRAGRVNARMLDWNGYAARFVAIVDGLRAIRTVKPRPSRLLLCDIDNTLTGCTVGALSMAAYLKTQPNLAFGVATGRSLQEAERLLGEWGQPAPAVLVTSVGAEIYWRDGARLIADADYSAHIDSGWNADAVDRRVCGLAGVERQPAVEQRRHKRSYFAEEPAVVAAIRAAVADLPVRVIHSHGRLLDIVPERAGKGAAMTWVAGKLGIARDHVYAAGDSGNDLDMLSICRNGILVANHSSELAGLVGRPTIYLARGAHAAGIVEGMRAFAMERAA